MSFLNSVLNSINGGKEAIPNPSVTARKERAVPETTQSLPNAKRKASSELSRSSDKNQVLETNTVTAATTLGPDNRHRDRSAAYVTGNAKQNPRAAPEAAARISKAAPKKGSFAEILARGKQNSALQVGQLTHKPKEKERMSAKKELLLQKEQARLKKQGRLNGNNKMTDSDLKDTPRDMRMVVDAKQRRVDRSTGQQEKPGDRIRPQPAYQGTAKPSRPQPAYRGTMKPVKDSGVRRGYNSEPDRARAKSPQKQRARYSDYESEDEDAESDHGYDYVSDDYSDMDAGFDDVDEEEAEAERAAKKEDMREQKMLEALATEKEERKKRARMAAGRKRGHK